MIQNTIDAQSGNCALNRCQCNVISGVFNVMLFLVLMDIVKATPRNVEFDVWSNFGGYLKLWIWPKSLMFNPHKADLFNETRTKACKKASTIKCDASKGLCLLPVFAIYILIVIRHMPVLHCPKACDVALALNDLIEALLAVPLGITTAKDLADRVHTLLVLCVECGYDEFFTPKFHWMLHYIHALIRWRGMLPTCWVHERKHKAVKRFATDIQNTKVFSTSVLKEVIGYQLWAMRQDGALVSSLGLKEPKDASVEVTRFVQTELRLPAGAAIKTSCNARLSSGSICASQDVVLMQSIDGINYVAAQILMFVSAGNDQCFALVDLWELVSTEPESGCGIWKVVSNTTFVPLAIVLAACIYCRLSGDRVRLIVPYQFRGLAAQDS